MVFNFGSLHKSTWIIIHTFIMTPDVVNSRSGSFKMCSLVFFVVLCMRLNHDNFLLVLCSPDWCVGVHDHSVDGLRS